VRGESNEAVVLQHKAASSQTQVAGAERRRDDMTGCVGVAMEIEYDNAFLMLVDEARGAGASTAVVVETLQLSSLTNGKKKKIVEA